MTRLRTILPVIIAGATAAVPAQPVSYAREVRPILAKNCLRCHGPDPGERKADLRLDRPSAAVLEHLVARITSDDPGEVMPPPRSGKTLTPVEIDVLRRWVGQGAELEQHWSFVPPRRPPLPPGTAAHPIDRFVQARQRGTGLVPSEAADRWTLVRRVHLDLVGLPPTPEEADAFVRDDRPDAYERLVDGLLASPHYGERWARRWLDLARYADTNGYEKDRERSIWPYRDWVIRALDADMGYDRFVIEQIAGDMLPGATQSQRIATGFHRNTMLNEEGGIDPLEYRFHAVTDRVATTGTAILGLTLGCAQCHTHKFDPVTHEEYWRLFALLDNTDEPDLVVDPAGWRQEIADRLRRARVLAGGLGEHWPVTAPPFAARMGAWVAEQRARAVTWTALRPVSATANLPRLVVAADGVVSASGDTTKHDVYRLRFGAAPCRVASLRLEALPDPRLPGGGPGMTYYEGTKGDFFLTEFEVAAAGKVIPVATATASYAKNRYGAPVGAPLAVDGDLQTGWSVDGRSGERHVAVFDLDRPLPAGTPFELEMHFGRHFASSLGRFRVSVAPRGAQATTLDEDVERLLLVGDEALDVAARRRLLDAFVLRAPELADPARAIHELMRPPVPTTTLVMQERPDDHRRPTRRHLRGEFLSPAERVRPGVPAVLRGGGGEPRDRLAFARWLVARDNPLAARVAVNRAWAAFFGRGIVATLGDFGVQGAVPSHPDLLDWLAVEFMARGWSRKALHRLIVTSATYRQASRVTPEMRAIDPENRWLARAPRFRLEAEILRDAALRAAGVLSPRKFGPPVRPPQPEGITEVTFGSPRWRAGRGEDRVRRSLYTFQKRTAPFALLHTFDAPGGETCIVQREVSNTPLQALSLLNDPQMVEVARAMGGRLAARVRDGEEVPATVRYAFRCAVTRPPTTDEHAELSRFLAVQRRRFADDPDRAAVVAGPGHRPVERATWTALARVLFALDETMTRN